MIRNQTRTRVAFLASALLAVALPATAEMVVDPAESSVSLISTKVVGDGSARLASRNATPLPTSAAVSTTMARPP